MKNISILLIFYLLAIQANAQINSADVDKIVEDEMIRQELPGLAIGVYKKGSISFQKGYGYIDINRTKAITTSTPFRWASISKTITAVATLQVAERQSSFSIDDKVTDHYPYWIAKVGSKDVTDKNRKTNITIKQLLTHRSGINHYANGVDYNKNSYKSDADHFNANSCVDVFRDMPLLFNPGDKYSYSTYGFDLLGAVIDKVTGSYPNWVKNNIANKLGMTSLKISYESFYGFQKKTDGIINGINIINKEYVLPGGGWESNIGDMLKFARGIMEGRLLTNTDALWASDYNQDYKRGINSIKQPNDFRIWHEGAHANLRTIMYIMPDNAIAVVVMIPVEYADAFNIVRRIISKMGINRNFDLSPDDKCKADIMGSSDKNFVGVWRKTQNDVIIRRGYSSDNFNKEWQFLTSKGYHLENFSCSDNLWNGIFKKGSGQYAMWRNFDLDAFNIKWQEMNNSGYRLYDLETYLVNGQRKWAGLFNKGTGKYALFRNLSTAAFGTERDELAKQGLKLIDIEVFSSGGDLKWSGVWVEGTDGLLNRNYNNSDFMNLVISRRKSGYQLIDIETYLDNGIRKWAGIWEKSQQECIVTYPRSFCQTMSYHSQNRNNGYELIDFESY